MVKVQCIVCGDTGYTAAPNSLLCKCGGKFKVVPENGKQQKVELAPETFTLFDTSNLIK